MNLSHHKLVQIGRKWLFRSHPIVITELATIGEEPDVCGFKNGNATLLECKATRADFRADKDKLFRVHPQLGIGAYRYYLTPIDLIEITELPDRWGLLETDGKRVFIRRTPTFFHERNDRQEKVILMSTIRRIAHGMDRPVSISAYSYTTENRATPTIDVDDETVEICEETEAVSA